MNDHRGNTTTFYTPIYCTSSSITGIRKFDNKFRHRKLKSGPSLGPRVSVTEKVRWFKKKVIMNNSQDDRGCRYFL